MSRCLVNNYPHLSISVLAHSMLRHYNTGLKWEIISHCAVDLRDLKLYFERCLTSTKKRGRKKKRIPSKQPFIFCGPCFFALKVWALLWSCGSPQPCIKSNFFSTLLSALMCLRSSCGQSLFSLLHGLCPFLHKKADMRKFLCVTHAIEFSTVHSAKKYVSCHSTECLRKCKRKSINILIFSSQSLSFCCCNIYLLRVVFCTRLICSRHVIMVLSITSDMRWFLSHIRMQLQLPWWKLNDCRLLR